MDFTFSPTRGLLEKGSLQKRSTFRDVRECTDSRDSGESVENRRESDPRVWKIKENLTTFQRLKRIERF